MKILSIRTCGRGGRRSCERRRIGHLHCSGQVPAAVELGLNAAVLAVAELDGIEDLRADGHGLAGDAHADAEGVGRVVVADRTQQAARTCRQQANKRVS